LSKPVLPLAAALALLAGPAALAQAAASAAAPASVIVGNVLAVQPTGDLNFGRVAIQDPASPAVVTVGPAGAVTAASNAAETPGAPVAAAAFQVSGVGAQSYAVTFPQPSVSLGAGADPPTVDSFTTSLAGGAGQLSGQSSGIGAQTFNVGARLHVPANTAPGAYAGRFQVDVAYN
jgi:hypothetical protein